jgi:hypothetical protein
MMYDALINLYAGSGTIALRPRAPLGPCACVQPHVINAQSRDELNAKQVLGGIV